MREVEIERERVREIEIEIERKRLREKVCVYLRDGDRRSSDGLSHEAITKYIEKILMSISS